MTPKRRQLMKIHLTLSREQENLMCGMIWRILYSLVGIGKRNVFTISVDNATVNDSCILIMKETFSLTKRLICDGKLFHVRCCVHILNIMVQHGLKQVKSIIKNVHDTVDYLNGSEQRLHKFSELVQQFNLKERKLILECKSRWNSTYDMLACAIKFKEVFSRLALEDDNYVYCLSANDWEKIEKLLEILKVFYDTTNIISGSEYPTSNLFLSEVYYIKEMLDKHFDSPDDFVRNMVKNMKERFDKYWGECNLLMAIGGVLDPRLKMKVVEITFPTMFPPNLVRENMNKVRDTLHELYDEYKGMYPPLVEELGESRGGSGTSNVVKRTNLPGMSRVLQVVRSGETFDSRKSELDPYRSKLNKSTVEMFICTSDWCKANYGVKACNKVDDMTSKPTEIILPIPEN